MNCSIAAGEQQAAKQALSVSEQELQRIKQMGCFTTQRDRAIMRNPDYRALPYPALSNPILSLEYDPNNKYTAAAQAEGFTSPFVDAVTNQRVQARPTVPGMSMAGTGDLAAIAGAYLEPEEEQKSRIYRRIADSIRGAPAKVSEESQTRQGVDEASLRELAMRQAQLAEMQPLTGASQVTAQMLYGGSQTGGAADAADADFFSRCKLHCRAALYDLMHLDGIVEQQLREEGFRHRVGFVTMRDGRLPYLLFVLSMLFLVMYVLGLMMSR
jgi:hypothetical protein